MSRLIVTGSVPYRSFKEKNRIIAGLQKEFNRKVKISVNDGIITYEHVHNEEYKSLLNNY